MNSCGGKGNGYRRVEARQEQADHDTEFKVEVVMQWRLTSRSQRPKWYAGERSGVLRTR